MIKIDNIPVWGDPLDNAVDQMKVCAKDAAYCALMADHHLGYSQPIGGVVAYRDKISPSGVGFDIACGNKAVRLDIRGMDVILSGRVEGIMDRIFHGISFGIGRKNKKVVDDELFGDTAWSILDPLFPDLKDKARSQLGTVGSGNHYVDLFVDEDDWVWVGVHFGSRGLGHTIASHFLKAAGGKDGIDAEPALLDVNSVLGMQYLACMNLAGRYAYAGRNWVCQKVAGIIGANIVEEVHNHHNFAWRENHFGEDLWVVRKGATPAFPGQLGFVGGSMAEGSVILKGIDGQDSKDAMYSTVHGAGRIMSRTQAAGKRRFKKGKQVKITEGEISQAMMMEKVHNAGVTLRGAGVDESPHCYKRLSEVLMAHANTIKIVHDLTPFGVAMAGANEYDPYKD